MGKLINREETKEDEIDFQQHLKNIENYIDELLINESLKDISIVGYSQVKFYPKCISDYGLTYLSNKLIKKSYPTTSLSFTFTRIKDEGLKELSELLLLNTNIISISFSRNLFIIKYR
jgi:hypothetical protein